MAKFSRISRLRLKPAAFVSPVHTRSEQIPQPKSPGAGRNGPRLAAPTSLFGLSVSAFKSWLNDESSPASITRAFAAYRSTLFAFHRNTTHHSQFPGFLFLSLTMFFL